MDTDVRMLRVDMSIYPSIYYLYLSFIFNFIFKVSSMIMWDLNLFLEITNIIVH